MRTSPQSGPGSSGSLLLRPTRSRTHIPLRFGGLAFGTVLALCCSSNPALADKKTWLFNGTTEGWTVSSGSSISDDGSNLVVNFATGGGLFSNTISPAFVPNSNGNYIRFGYKLTSGNISQFKFNFKTTARNNFSSTDFFMALRNDGNWHWVTFRVDNIVDWTSSTITQLRFIALTSSGGGASGSLYLDYCFLRWDDANPYAPTITTVSTGDWINHDASIDFSCNDPPPNGFPSPVGPDVYGSGVNDFRWHIDNGADTPKSSDNFDEASGLATATVNVRTTDMHGGYNVFHVYAFDKVARAGSDNTFTIRYDPNPPPAPTAISANPSSWTNSNNFSFSWNYPGDDWSGVRGYDWIIDGGAVSGSTGLTSVSDVQVPAAGVHYFQVRADDAAGNIGDWSSTIPVFYDPVSPDVPGCLAVNPSGWSSNDDFCFSWCPASDAHSGISSYEMLLDSGSPTNIGNVTSICGIAFGSPGVHTFRIRSVDEAGNRSSWSSPVSARYDPIPPGRIGAPTVAPPGYTKVNSFTFSWGAATDNLTSVTYDLYINRGYVGSTTQTSAIIASQADEGPNEFAVLAYDEADNPGPPDSVAFYFDSQPPSTPSITSVAPAGWTSSNSFNVTWSAASDASSGVARYEWAVDGGQAVATQTTSLSGLTVPSAGVHQFTVRAVDVAGNMGNWSAPDSMYFDNVAPSPPLDLAVDPPGYTSTNNYSFTWNDGGDVPSGVASFDVRVNGVSRGSVTATETSGALASQTGTNTFEVRARDRAGNLSSWVSIPFYYSPGFIEPPTVFSPADSDSVALPETFGWNSIPNVSSYEVQVATNGNFTSSSVWSATSDLSSIPIPVVAAPTVGARYFWRVRPVGSIPPDNWSEPQSFVTKTPLPPPPAQVVGLDFPSGESGDGVNTALGAVTRSFTILTLRGPGGEAPLTATYLSQSQRGGSLGNKWTWTLGQQLTVVPNVQATASLEDAQDIRFAWRNQEFAPDLGVYDSLQTAGSNFELVRPSKMRLSFGSNGQLQAIRDRNGNTIGLTYSSGVLSQFTDAVGRTFNVTTSAGRVTQIQDILGRTWRFDYDGNGYLSRFTDAAGHVTQFEYDAQGRLTRVIDPLGNNALWCTFGADGRVLTQTDAVGGVTTFSYDDVNFRTTVTNPLGGTQIHVRDASSRLVQDINERGDSTVYSYDANHNRVSVKDGRGKVTRYEYDTRGNIVRVTDPLGGVTRTIYDFNNSPTERTDALGNITRYTNDTHGNPTKIDESLEKTTQYQYNNAGQVTQVTDANSHVSLNSYDGRGNRTSSRNGAGDLMTYTYDGVGRRLTITDGLAHTTTFTYSADDSLLSQANGLGQTATYQYDANGNRIAVIDPRNGRTDYAYDAKDRLIQIRGALGNLTLYAYDALDRKIRTTDPRGGVTTFEYDPVGNLVREQDALGNATTHTYDANRNRLSTTDARVKTTLFTYDPINRVLTTTDPLGHVTSNAYDLLGRLVSVTNPRHYQTNYSYDALGRLTAVQAPTGGALQYGYDQVGNRTTTTNANGHTTTMTYDGADRLVTTTDPLGNTQRYAYDAAGHRSQRTDARGRVTLYSYDAADRLIRTTYDDSSRIQRAYDANGNLTSLTDQWGSDSYTYDALNRIVGSIDHYSQPLAFGYDSTGNLVALTYPGGQTCRYTFDPLDRLTAVTDWNSHAVSYGYDATGNNTAVNYPNGVATTQVFDDAGRLTCILTKTPAQDTLVSFAYTLDENGNRTRIVRVDKREDPQRIGGPDVYGTSAALSSQAFPTGADSIVVASGDSWEEAVNAPLLAKQLGAPALMVPGDNLWASSAIQSELGRLKSVRPDLGAVVLGDISGVSAIVEAQLGQQGIPLRRIRGNNRFATIAEAAASSPLGVLLGGTDQARAGIAALLAARRGATVLLTERDSVPEPVRSALGSLGVARTIIVGDETTVGPGVADWLNSNGHPVLKRYDSADLSALSVQALEESTTPPDRFETLRVVDRDIFQDGLSAAAEPNPSKVAILLSGSGSVRSSPELVRWIGRHKGWLQHTVLLGPNSGLSANAEAELRTLLRTTVTDFTYNPLDELTSEDITGVDSTYYAYNAMGNRASITHRDTQTTYTYDAADRLVAAGTASYTYDGNGNRLTTGSSQNSSYSYDYENRLTQIVGPEGTSSYRYDGLGRRIRALEPNRTIRYVLDPTSKPYRTLRETDGTGTTLMNYTHGLGMASEVGPNSLTRYYHYDGLGSTAAITDVAGTDVAHLAFEAFGDMSLDLGEPATHYGYVGQYGVETATNGLQFMRDRFYDAETGTFLSIDVIDLQPHDFLSPVQYVYASGNPVNRIDPDGRFPKRPKSKSAIVSDVRSKVGWSIAVTGQVAKVAARSPAAQAQVKVVTEAAGVLLGGVGQIVQDVSRGTDPAYIPGRAIVGGLLSVPFIALGEAAATGTAAIATWGGWGGTTASLSGSVVTLESRAISSKIVRAIDQYPLAGVDQVTDWVRTAARGIGNSFRRWR